MLGERICAFKKGQSTEGGGRSVGVLYLYGADSIRKGTPNGLEVALGESRPSFSLVSMARVTDHVCAPSTGASALLLLSSLPRVAKGPVPAVLSATSAASALYYGKTVLALRS